jgi:hypothetical protein
MTAAVDTTDSDRVLGEAQAADFLKLSIRTLQAWRSQGKGPAYIRAGRSIRYRMSALIAWMNDNTVTP